MIDYELLVKKIFEYLKVLFPDFETCRNYYYDKNLDSNDLVKKLVAMSTKQFKYKIDTFDFETYINTTSHPDLHRYIISFLPEKYSNTGTLIFNTFAKRILFNVHDNEEKFKEDSSLFLEMIKKEVDEFIKLVQHFTEYNSYLFYSNEIYIDKELKGKYLTNEILFHSMDKNAIFVMENIDFNIRDYCKIIRLLVHALSLIYTEKIIFNQFADTHTMLLEKYGCKNISLYPINNKPWHTSHYSIPFIPFEPKVKLNIDNFDEVKSLLSKYMDILKNLDKDDYKRVSLDFYMDAIDKIDAAQITYSIISIEALFNVSHSDIQKTVIQRGLKILQNFYPQEYWEKIESDLKIAYDIRSDYAHGERRRTKKANWVLSARILEYARIILSVFLQLSFIVEVERKKIKEKKYINNYLIEKSLLYPDINSRFCEILNNLQIYVKDFDEIGNSYINILEDNSNSKEQIPKTIIDR